MNRSTFTAILEKEDDLFVALCPELDVASQGATVEEATASLKEAVSFFLNAQTQKKYDSACIVKSS